MEAVIQNSWSLVIAILALLAGVGQLAFAFVNYQREQIKTPSSSTPDQESGRRQSRRISMGGGFMVVGFVILLARILNPPPIIAITSPSGSVDVTTEGSSVWFPVSGRSTNVVSNNALRICVLVFSSSGAEWHVQRPAAPNPDGDWTLAKAWTADKVAQGFEIRILALATQRECQQDAKLSDYRELNPVAASSEVIARVQNVK